MRAPFFTGFVVLLLALTAPLHAAPDDLPETPSRQAVVDAMQRVTPAVVECGRQGVHGSLSVSFFFESSGALTSVTMPPAYDNTDLGRCFDAALRTARLPPFRRPTFTVNYPFRY